MSAPRWHFESLDPGWTCCGRALWNRPLPFVSHRPEDVTCLTCKRLMATPVTDR